MSNGLNVDQVLRIKAMQMAIDLWVQAQNAQDLNELAENIYEFIKGENDE